MLSLNFLTKDMGFRVWGLGPGAVPQVLNPISFTLYPADCTL